MQEAHCTSLGGTPRNPTRSEPLPVEPGKKMERRERQKQFTKATKLKTVNVTFVSTACVGAVMSGSSLVVSHIKGRAGGYTARCHNEVQN